MRCPPVGGCGPLQALLQFTGIRVCTQTFQYDGYHLPWSLSPAQNATFVQRSHLIFLSAILWSACLLPASAVAGSNDPGAELSLISAVGIAVIIAALVTILFYRIKLPALLAYIVSGVMIGVFAGQLLGHSAGLIDEISHIGLVFLLFIIGMEMDLGGIRQLGRRAAVAIVLQVPVAFAGVYALQWAAHGLGISLPGLGSRPEAWFFYALACSLGSTAVVVKLLGDKFDLGSQAGKITVLTLIIEDVWAVGALSYVHSQGVGGGTGLWLMLGGGAVFTAIIVLLSRFLLSRAMLMMARAPDLLTLIALGWCFFCAEGFSRIGLSAEMGALMAGLTLARLPQHREVLSKVASLRDFFMALFFVALGISLPAPTLVILLQALALVAMVIVARLLLYVPLLLGARQGPITALVVAINLAQVSEFCLLIIPLGVAYGMIGVEDQVIISYALMISVVLATFTINNNYRIAMLIERMTGLTPQPSVHHESGGTDAVPYPGRDIVMLGYFVNTEAIMRHLAGTCPELLERILVIDFNIEKHARIREHHIEVAYGDISNPQTLRQLGIAQAKVIVSTISNAFLHGIRNEQLLEQIRAMNPSANFISTCLTIDGRENLLRKGAFACISTPVESAPAYTRAIQEALADYEHRDAKAD